MSGLLIALIMCLLVSNIESKSINIKRDNDWDTWYIAPNGNDGGPGTYQEPFKTLTRAVGVSLDNDHIVLLRGTYYGPQNCGLTITKNLTFETYEDPGNVVLNCYGIKAPGMIVGAGMNVSLNRLTISFAQQSGFVASPNSFTELVQVNLFQNQGTNGGAIWAQNNSTVVVRNSALNNNIATLGGAIYVDIFANVTEDQAYSTINSNEASGNGGGIFVSSNAILTWKTGLFNNNTATMGGAIYAVGPNTNVTIADLKVTFNYAHTSGGGVAFENGVNAILLHVTTQQNTAKTNGGGVWCNNSTIDQDGCVLHLNQPQNLFCTQCTWTDTNRCNCLRCPSSMPRPAFNWFSSNKQQETHDNE